MVKRTGNPGGGLVEKNKIMADRGKECFTRSNHEESFIDRLHVIFQRDKKTTGNTYNEKEFL